MSPRPRKVSDDELFAAVQALMVRVSPNQLTLAAIAKEAGITPAALVQRFGSKRGLMIALMQKFSDGSGELVAMFERKYDSPLAALHAYADCVADMAATPAAFVRSLAYLQNDLSDSDLRRLLAKHARTTREGLRRLIEAAARNGELRPDAPAASLARTVEAIFSGSMLTWVIYQEGTARKWVRVDLDAVLAPYSKEGN